MVCPEDNPTLIEQIREENSGTFHHPVIHDLPLVVRARNENGGETLYYTYYTGRREDVGKFPSRVASDLHPEPFLINPPGEVPEGLIRDAAAQELLPGEVRFYRKKEVIDPDDCC